MIRFFVLHPTASNLLMLMLLAAGALTIPNLRMETFPNFSPEEVEVVYVYPGATAEEVEQSICHRVEDALDAVKYVSEVRCDAREGVGIIIVKMTEGGAADEFLDEIQTEVDGIDELPEEVEDAVVRRLHTTESVLDVIVSGLHTVQDLKAYCEDLKQRLQQLPEVALVRIQGFSDRQLRIELSKESMMRYRLSAAQVADIINRQNVNLPAGSVEARERDIVVRFVEQRKTANELKNIVVVAGQGGAEIRLGDIATVKDAFELNEEKVMLGDQRAAIIKVEKTRNQDTIRVARAVKQFVEAERQRTPDAMQFIVTNDLSTLTRDRLLLLGTNCWQGAILVLLTMWLFFNLKLSFWVVMSLPVSFLGAAFFLPMLDLTINMFTIVGVLLALGILMDDGIVIAENVATHFARGKSTVQAAVDGVTEVRSGVVASFLTTVCVLGPLMFVRGDMGKVLKVLPMVLILVIAISLVEAFLILPAHLSHSLRRSDLDKSKGFRHHFDGIIEWTRENLLGTTIDRLLRWRYLWIGCVVGLFFLSLAMVAGGILRVQAFPDLDGNLVAARVLMPQGTPLHQTERVVGEITSALDRVNEQWRARQPDEQNLVQAAYVRYNQNTDALENGPHVATVFVDLLAADQRIGRVDEILAAWRQEVGGPADALSLVFTDPAIGPAGRAIEVRLYGHDLVQLRAASAELRQWFSEFAGVTNLVDDLRPGKEELRMRLREGAYGLGLDSANMSRQLRAAFQGLTADEIQVGAESYEIDVRLHGSDQDSLADLDYFHFTLPSGAQVPLHSVATVERARGWARIARVNGFRTVTLRGDVDARVSNTRTLMAEMESDIMPQLLSKYPEISYSIEGEIRQATTTQRSIVAAGMVGILGVYVLLSFQFRSYVEPLIVMLAIPFALIGVIWGHFLLGYDVSIPSIFGFFSLAGVVVNDSILLVLFLKMEREGGTDYEIAAGRASRQRFRAIALTSITTIAGLLPLLLERSLQAQVLIPLAISIVFGLFASTLLVLLVIPCLYAILGDMGLTGGPTHETASTEMEAVV